VSLFNLVKFYIAKEVNADELLHIIGFLVVAREENMVGTSVKNKCCIKFDDLV
jgi:hypothetical protein